MSFSETINSLALDTIESVTGLRSKDFDIHQVSIDSSVLYQEITILFSYQLDKSGLFQTNKNIRELKYDFSNKCGVMNMVSGRDDRNPKILKVYGDEGILMEKEWI